MTRADSPEPFAARSRLSALAWPFVFVLTSALVATNVATVASASFHDLMFGVVERALLIAGADVAEKALGTSMKRVAETNTRKATAALSDENASLKAKNQDLDAKHGKLRAEADGLKVAHAKAHADLGDLQARRAGEASYAKKMATSVRARLAKGVARNNAAIPAEAMPYIGIGVTVSLAALDIYDACQTTKEINELMKLLGQGEENADFCGMKAPTVPEVLGKMKTGWKVGVEQVAAAAKAAPLGVPIPEVRLPSAKEVQSVVCPIVGSALWIAC